MNEDNYRLHRRFDRMGRLVGDAAMGKLFSSRVVVIGLGGVGSFAAEAIARSGVGHLTLVDFDLVCVTNANRQIQAMRGTVGKPKATVLAERLRLINPSATVKAVPLFYDARVSDMLLSDDVDYVVDAIDNVNAKCHLLAACRSKNIPVVCSTGAAGRFDPTLIQVTDLSDTRGDRLGKAVRKMLRQEHDFPRVGSFGIPAVFSPEPARAPIELHYDGGEGFRCVCPNENDVHSCENRNIIWGTAGFVTGSFGLAAAGVVIRALVGEPT
jgi:tRNA A37 threonylcarbamoyladenosine dehydratase